MHLYYGVEGGKWHMSGSFAPEEKYGSAAILTTEAGALATGEVPAQFFDLGSKKFVDLTARVEASGAVAEVFAREAAGAERAAAEARREFLARFAAEGGLRVSGLAAAAAAEEAPAAADTTMQATDEASAVMAAAAPGAR